MAATTESVPVIHQCYTLSKVRFPSGTIIALDEHQAATRRHMLQPVSDGIYTANDWLEFKAGEVIGLTQLPKSLDGLVSPCEVLEEAIDDDPKSIIEGEAPQPDGVLAPSAELLDDGSETVETGLQYPFSGVEVEAASAPETNPEEQGESEATSEKPAKKPKAHK